MRGPEPCRDLVVGHCGPLRLEDLDVEQAAKMMLPTTAPDVANCVAAGGSAALRARQQQQHRQGNTPHTSAAHRMIREFHVVLPFA